MPPVKKPKANIIKKQISPVKPTEQVKVVSGQLKKKLPTTKPKQKKRPERGVVLVKHLPHGFFEQQLRQYFRQFGHVTRVRLARSDRTGGSKGFAFVEFQYPEVAKVAAETMDNYLMFQKVVKALYIPPEQQRLNYFKTSVKKVKNKAGKEIFVSDLTKRTNRNVQKQNNWNDAACQKRTDAGLRKLKKMQEKYKHLGIDFSHLLVEPEKKSKSDAGNEAEQPRVSKSQSSKKSKKLEEKPELELADLLGNTINEDSDDENYEMESEEEDSEQIDSDEEEDLDSEEDDDEEEELPKQVAAKKSKKIDLIKRKHGTGGIQKKKPPPVAKSTKKKQTLQLAAAKQLAKPLKKDGKQLKKKK